MVLAETKPQPSHSVTTAIKMGKLGCSTVEDFDKLLNRQLNFKHTEIDARTQIRLLRLRRNPTIGGVHCTFHVVSLKEIQFVRYKALSYTWGNAHGAEDVQKIHIVNQPFFVRQNLFQFMQIAVQRGEDGLFFIDAVCINQLDHKERLFQVRQMARVYRNATQVIAWLGVTDAGQLDNIQALNAVKNKDCSLWTRSQWEGFRYISYVPYWTRIWVIQEVLLASSLVIWCGNFTFSPAIFGRGCNTVTYGATRFAADGRPSTIGSASARVKSPAENLITHRLRYFFRPTKDALTEATSVGTLEEMTNRLIKPAAALQTYQSTTADLISQLISKFGKLECSDPRDKLYGMLGLLSEASRDNVEPDYGRDVSYAYYQTLKVGIGEIWPKDDGTEHPHWIESMEGSFISFYCHARDGFGLEDEVCMPILRQVLKGLGFRARMKEAIFDAQLQQQFGWCPSQIRRYQRFRKMIIDIETKKPETTHGLLSRFHNRQRQMAESL
jgi:hypothetical protein